MFAYAAYRGLLQLAHEAPASLPAEWASYAALTRQTFLPEAPPKRGQPRRATR